MQLTLALYFCSCFSTLTSLPEKWYVFHITIFLSTECIYMKLKVSCRKIKRGSDLHSFIFILIITYESLYGGEIIGTRYFEKFGSIPF